MRNVKLGVADPIQQVGHDCIVDFSKVERIYDWS